MFFFLCPLCNKVPLAFQRENLILRIVNGYNNRRKEMLISIPKVPRLVHLPWTTSHPVFPSTLQHCKCKQPTGWAAARISKGVLLIDLQQEASHRCCFWQVKRAKSQGEAHVTARSVFLLFYKVILVFGNRTLAHSRVKKIQQNYVLLKSKIPSKTKGIAKFSDFCNNFI